MTKRAREPRDPHEPYMLYFAYGSNLDVAQMQMRCPDAVKIGRLILPNAVLRFRGVADVAYLQGGQCPGGLWEVSKADIVALDRYEGVNHQSPEYGLYQKKYLRLMFRGEDRYCLYYMMNQTGIMPPSQGYLDTIAQGYRDFGLDLEKLKKALDHSWWRRRKTPALRERYKRKGMPRLAKEISVPAEADVVVTKLRKRRKVG